jgi:diguanylate cyclase (GGDEF)-like protein/PAS domain S-box-containing protein
MQTTNQTAPVELSLPLDHPTIISESSPTNSESSPPETSNQDRLVRQRLGTYAGLYYALKAKHPPAAAHCLRVALGCSKWSAFCQLPEPLRDLIEIAGLLHDIGKIGAPDHVLQKPEALTNDEQQSMESTVTAGIEILEGAGASSILIEIIQQFRYSFDSGKATNPLARMLKIADAFDSMITMQVFRPAISRERAIEELYANSGTQFDPELVKNFVELVSRPRPELEQHAAQRWLGQFTSLQPYFAASSPIQFGGENDSVVSSLFHNRLLDTLTEATIYLDNRGKILLWNRAAEQLSGHPAESVLYHQWSPALLSLQTHKGIALDQNSCPLNRAMLTNTKYEATLLVCRSEREKIEVRLTAIPLFANTNHFIGFILLIQDASSQSALKQELQSLSEMATRDPLTKVANRAELDRRLSEFVEEHSATKVPGAVIMCDIDFFKRINDQLSHQAGDQALITFANILKDMTRERDLVARFGGEEFVILCPSCDINSAHSKAERIRRFIESTPVPALNGRSLTCSFGVTELQEGDDMETFLARADRALLKAKENGRNRVIQLGAGHSQSEKKADSDPSNWGLGTETLRSTWLSWLTGQRHPIMSGEYLSSVPISIAVQKLEGFINDHRAEILSANHDQLSVRIKGGDNARRRGEHPTSLIMDVVVQEVQFCTLSRAKVYQNRTKFQVKLFTDKTRDRRKSSFEGQAKLLLQSFQAYIGGQQIDEELRLSIIEPR